MKKILCGLVMLAVLAVGGVGAEKAKPKTIKEIMKEGHTGEPALCAKASKGEASKDEAAKLVSLYEDLAVSKPPQGNPNRWKTKTTALVDATKKLASDPANEDAVAGFKKAVNCAGCHGEYKPKKPK